MPAASACRVVDFGSSLRVRLARLIGLYLSRIAGPLEPGQLEERHEDRPSDSEDSRQGSRQAWLGKYSGHARFSRAEECRRQRHGETRLREYPGYATSLVRSDDVWSADRVDNSLLSTLPGGPRAAPSGSVRGGVDSDARASILRSSHVRTSFG